MARRFARPRDAGGASMRVQHVLAAYSDEQPLPDPAQERRIKKLIAKYEALGLAGDPEVAAKARHGHDYGPIYIGIDGKWERFETGRDLAAHIGQMFNKYISSALLKRRADAGSHVFGMHVRWFPDSPKPPRSKFNAKKWAA
jgi:hypothetical protein